jgi:hypothetical protein
MHTYEVHLSFQGKQLVEFVTCNGSSAAAQLVRSRYPGAYIGYIKQVR